MTISASVKKTFLFMFLILLMAAASLWGFYTVESSRKPDNEDGEKFRIGYFEGEPFVNFAGTFYGLLEGFQEVGWLEGIEDMPYEPGQEDSRIMWEWLASQDNSDYLEFVADAHYSFFLEPGREEELLSRLEKEQDLDLVITMGTYAGKSLSSASHNVPVLVFSSSNAVSSGIIDSAEDSGRSNIWAHMDPGRDRRQVDVFYDLFDFHKMGIVYEDSELGKIFSAINEVEAVAEERGFTIERRLVDEPADRDDWERYYSELLKAHKELAEEIDAFYISIASIEAERLEYLLTPFYEKNIPVFSQLGGEEVRSGAVASVARANFTSIGRYGASVIKRVLEGESPQSLPQVFMETPRIAVNLQAAERVGYQIPFTVLLVADQIYLTVE